MAYASAEKKRAAARAWRQSNLDEVRAAERAGYARNAELRRTKKRAWRAAHPERTKEIDRVWREANADKHRANARAWGAANRERKAEVSAAWAKRNPEKVKASGRAWHKAHPENARERKHRRRAREKAAHGTWTADDLRLLQSILGDRCLHPGCRTPTDRVAVDHVIPLARGGSNQPTNLQPLCVHCNTRKCTRRTDYRTPQQIKKILRAFQLSLFAS